MTKQSEAPAGVKDPTSSGVGWGEAGTEVDVPCPPPPRPRFILPPEIVGCMFQYLGGKDLLQCSLVCRTWEYLSRQRDLWKALCVRKWPRMADSTLPQLPGAPDYDLIRLYGGCWKRCFFEGHKRNQHTGLFVDLHGFPDLDGERVESEVFTVEDHHFCLWIYPRGNPHEPEYAGRVFSMYLVITNLEDRGPNWTTCAVFTLSVVNHKDPSKSLEWHSSLSDIRFDEHLTNWGVHSLGRLDVLMDSAQGFLEDDSLEVGVQLRLMTITFCIVTEKHMKSFSGFGLADMEKCVQFDLPFCCTLAELMEKIQDVLGCPPENQRLWCFNQPITSGQALRPRRPLSLIDEEGSNLVPLFGSALRDGIDIDAYSFCQIYLEDLQTDEPLIEDKMQSLNLQKPWNLLERADKRHHSVAKAQETNGEGESDAAMKMDVEEVNASSGKERGLIFVKMLDHVAGRLHFLGRASFSDSVSPSLLYDYVSRLKNIPRSALLMCVEDLLPCSTLRTIPPSEKSVVHPDNDLAAADIVVFSVRDVPLTPARAFANLLGNLYHEACKLSRKSVGSVTLEQVENLAEKLGIQKFRVRSAFRKCCEDARKTLQYIMEGRHLGFICDKCGETDFPGVRYNCQVCEDYDLCEDCQTSSDVVSHRYANVQGKWQKQLNFNGHHSTHSVSKVLPVFYGYTPPPDLVREVDSEPMKVLQDTGGLPGKIHCSLPAKEKPSGLVRTATISHA